MTVVDKTYLETKPYEGDITNRKNLILRRFKCRVLDQIPNQSWIKPPPEWQLLKTEGGNVVWNNTKIITATKQQHYQSGDEVWVVTGWMMPVQDGLDPARFFDAVDPILPSAPKPADYSIHYEPRMWVDADQSDTYYPEYPTYDSFR